MKAIFLNGPPRSGKDTLGGLISRYIEKNSMWAEPQTAEFKAPLLETLSNMFDDYRIWCGKEYDEKKDEPNDKLFGHTPRELMIWLGEEVIKPKFGKNFFGKIMLYNMDRNYYHREGIESVFIFTDSGFRDEVMEVINHLGAENCLMVCLLRDGCDFEKDSRGWLLDLPVETLRIENKGTIKDLSKVAEEISQIILKD